MPNLARRFPNNPILRPGDVKPSVEGLSVECLLNPGAFRYDGKTWLLMRVAERPPMPEGLVTTAILDPSIPSGVRPFVWKADDPGLDLEDPRGIGHQGEYYLSTLSHLRLAWSTDGETFEVADAPTLIGDGALEPYGVEDCRVVELDGTYYLTYTAVSDLGFGVGLMSTRDWKAFDRHGMILPPSNKDFALIPDRIGDYYYGLHRPTFLEGSGRNHIWISRSPDLLHWGDHRMLARTRPGMWDGGRIGAGAEPIHTAEGWLEIYHGATPENRYCLGALLLDLEDPTRVLARSEEPIMEPEAEYEVYGFFGQVVFTNGHVVDGDELTMYYGASDEVICGARFSIREILANLR